MKNKLLILLITLTAGFLSGTSSYAQNWGRGRKYAYKQSTIAYEVGGGVGVSNFMGELGGANKIGTNFANDLDMRSSRYAFNIFGRIFYHRRFAQKVSFSYIKLYGSDARTEEAARNNRNLTFRAPVFEMSTQFEVYLISETPQRNRYKLRGAVRRGSQNPCNLYLFGGVAGFYFNPKGPGPDGRWHALQPLHTEGQGAFPTRQPYKRFQLAIPFGLGFSVRVSPLIRIGFEAGLRKTFTDYIDDVSTTYVDPATIAASGSSNPALAAAMADPSKGNIPGATAPGQQRGDPRDKDAYMTLMLNVHFRIGGGRTSMPKFF